MTDTHPYPRVARVQCMNPPCPEVGKVKQVPLPHLGDGVYLVPSMAQMKCGHCGNFGPMNHLFGDLPEGGLSPLLS